MSRIRHGKRMINATMSCQRPWKDVEVKNNTTVIIEGETTPVVVDSVTYRPGSDVYRYYIKCFYINRRAIIVPGDRLMRW